MANSIKTQAGDTANTTGTTLIELLNNRIELEVYISKDAETSMLDIILDGNRSIESKIFHPIKIVITDWLDIAYQQKEEIRKSIKTLLFKFNIESNKSNSEVVLDWLRSKASSIKGCEQINWNVPAWEDANIY